MAKRVAKKSEPFSAGCYTVEGRLFSTRPEAEEYCRKQRIPAFKIGLAPPLPDDVIKLSVAESWSLRVLFADADPILVFEHASDLRAFRVRMSDLADLVSSVKARVRELAKAGER